MKKSYKYEFTRFSAEVLRKTASKLFEGFDYDAETPTVLLTVILNDGEWSHDDEEEFFNDYSRAKSAVYIKQTYKHAITVYSYPTSTVVEVKVTSLPVPGYL